MPPRILLGYVMYIINSEPHWCGCISLVDGITRMGWLSVEQGGSGGDGSSRLLGCSLFRVVHLSQFELFSKLVLIDY